MIRQDACDAFVIFAFLPRGRREMQRLYVRFCCLLVLIHICEGNAFKREREERERDRER